MANGSFILKNFLSGLERVDFNPVDACHCRAALNYFNPMSPDTNRWYDPVSETEFRFNDCLEYPSLPDMVREMLMYQHLREVTGHYNIEDATTIRSRMRASEWLGGKPAVKVVDIKISEVDPEDIKGIPTAEFAVPREWDLPAGDDNVHEMVPGTSMFKTMSDLMKGTKVMTTHKPTSLGRPMSVLRGVSEGIHPLPSREYLRSSGEDGLRNVEEATAALASDSERGYYTDIHKG